MRAGQLDRRIAIQAKSVTQSDSGQEVVTWMTIATVWAQLVELRGLERFGQRQFTGHNTVTFRFRWSDAASAVTTTHQISFDGRSFDITDVRLIGLHDVIEIDAFAQSEEPVAP